MTNTTTSTLDPATLTVIREALADAQAGRLSQACAKAEQGLSAGGDLVALNALLGMLRGNAGDAPSAIHHLTIAHRGRPDDVRIAANLASALASSGDLKQAMDVASAERAMADPSLQLARIRGYVAQMLEDPAAAIDAYQLVVAKAPDDWESWNNLGNAHLAMDDVEGGISALGRAAGLNPESAPTRLNLARAYRKAGRVAEAERELRAMADQFPEDTLSLADLRELLREQGHPDEEILALYRESMRRAPQDQDLLIAAARHLVSMLEMAEAEQLFRQALALDPVATDAFVGLATVYEHSRPNALPELAEQAQRAGAPSSLVNLLTAFACRRSKQFAEGLDALAKVPEELEPARRAELLGQCYEGLGRYDEAFAAFTRMNEIHAGSQSQPVERAARLRDELRERLRLTTPDWVASWATGPVAPERPSPIFLVGFPRSGTTLLDTMLMGHPGLAVMEERPALSRLALEIGGFEALAGLDADAVRRAQRRYFDIVREYVPLNYNDLVVDKSPLLLNAVPVIHRLFPGAKFILALRHPADSVLSCFTSNFRLNASMSNFVRLDSAAEFYDLTFRNWERACEILPVEAHAVKYEQLVEDPERELRQLSDALGLDWADRMLDHRRTAAERGVISTASYAQVTEPIYRRSVGRWHNYRKHLEPILPVLAPWIGKFGYEL